MRVWINCALIVREAGVYQLTTNREKGLTSMGWLFLYVQRASVYAALDQLDTREERGVL